MDLHNKRYSVDAIYLSTRKNEVTCFTSYFGFSFTAVLDQAFKDYKDREKGIVRFKIKIDDTL